MLEFFLGQALLGDVAGHLGEAEQPAGLVVDRIDQDVGPEPLAVLAHALGFAGKLALAERRGQGPGRGAGFAVLGRVEQREMPADDLAGGVALDRFGPGVPVRDRALRVEHVDRVVVDALDQQPEALLALEQRPIGLAPFRDVAGDLGVADQFAVVDHGIDHHVTPKARAVLAHPPAFGLEPAGFGGGPQGAFGHAGLAVLLGIEGREVSADDLVGRIALE